MSQSYSIYPGQKLVFSVPCVPEKGYGEYPLKKEGLVLGWEVDDKNAGSLEVAPAGTVNGCAVIYTHASATAGNILTFTAADGRRELVSLVLSISSIHDHSELGQGGPAFGTYASLLDEELPEQG